MFESRATYGILLWGASSAMETIFRLQKEAVRALAGVPKRTTCRNLYPEHQILTLLSLFVLACLKYVHESPQKFIQNGNLHTYSTRSQNLYRKYVHESPQKFIQNGNLHTYSTRSQNLYTKWKSPHLFHQIPKLIHDSVSPNKQESAHYKPPCNKTLQSTSRRDEGHVQTKLSPSGQGVFNAANVL
ncbi:hypothetical protein QE152_g15723 [Popillia japonica]|uniref:Uncharacterized protein n=1 Tax=Popillia japonica TaxID=7064 RepID=A0AAW1L767_POPJA